MNDSERAFLVQVALGVFVIDTKGRIWRRGIMAGGSHCRTPGHFAALRQRRRAETSQKTGYPMVMFTVEGRRMAVAAHRIVWMIAHHQDIPTGMELNHGDGDRANHCPQNLECVTRSENVRHACRVLGRKPKDQNGSKNAIAKLTTFEVREIRRLCAESNLTQDQIASMFGIGQSNVSRIHLRQGWTQAIS